MCVEVSCGEASLLHSTCADSCLVGLGEPR